MKTGSTYFISDLHLGAKFMEGNHYYEQRVVAWLDSIKADCSRLYLVGDILDYWYEYKHAVPKGFVRFFGKLAEMADSGIEITWMAGNHDVWLFGYFEKELGIKLHDGPIVTDIEGLRLYIDHGDGTGEVKPSMRFLRWLFRNKLAQLLYGAVHPRWTVPLATGLSFGSRKNHKRTAERLKERLAERIEAHKQKLIDFADSYSDETSKPIDFFIFGHLHTLSLEPLPHAAGKIVFLGDWIGLCSFARIADGKLEISRFNYS